MAPTREHHDIAASIDKEVSTFPDTAGGMEQLLVNMYKYMHDFKRILDTSAPGDMDMLCSQYPHFYRFAKLMEQLAEGIAAGDFDDVLGKGRLLRRAPPQNDMTPAPGRGHTARIEQSLAILCPTLQRRFRQLPRSTLPGAPPKGQRPPTTYSVLTMVGQCRRNAVTPLTRSQPQKGSPKATSTTSSANATSHTFANTEPQKYDATHPTGCQPTPLAAVRAHPLNHPWSFSRHSYA